MARTRSESPITNASLTDQVYEYLRERLPIDPEYPPGARIFEDELAERIGVSRTPVREALLRLERDGLVEIVPRRGIYVRKPTAEQVNEIYDIREALEGLALRRAVARAGPELVEALERACEEFDAGIQVGDAFRCVKADESFHAAIVQASGYPRLIDMLNVFQIQILSIAVKGPNYLDLAPTYLDQHRSITAAIKARDAQAAVQRLHEHIVYGKRIALQGFEEAREASQRRMPES